MARTITLEMPEEIYDSLLERAAEVERSPEKVAVEWLAVVSHWMASDPLAKLIGALHTDVPDWADNHDYYIGMAALDTHDDESDPASENG